MARYFGDIKHFWRICGSSGKGELDTDGDIVKESDGLRQKVRGILNYDKKLAYERR